VNENPAILKAAYEKQFGSKKSKQTKEHLNFAEKQQIAREKNIQLYGSQTAKACYEQASEKDKTYLRKITRYEKGSMILSTIE
jgi:hypothetical protein